jgi:hypothetical protein
MNLNSNTEGSVKLCCSINENIHVKDSDGNELNFGTHSIEEIWKIEENWKMEVAQMSLKQLRLLKGTSYKVTLPDSLIESSRIKVEIVWPNPKIPSYINWNTVPDVKYKTDAGGKAVLISADKALDVIKSIKLKSDAQLKFRVHYIAKN